MISRELWTRLRVGLKADQMQAGNIEWRGGEVAPQFKLKAMWAGQAASGAPERWRVSFSCHHKNITIDTTKPRPRLRLVESKAS